MLLLRGNKGTDLNKDVPVTIIIKRVGVENFELFDITTPALRLSHELFVGIRALRVLVEHLHVAVGWGGIDVVVELLDVLAVVAFVASNTDGRS